MDDDNDLVTVRLMVNTVHRGIQEKVAQNPDEGVSIVLLEKIFEERRKISLS